MSHLRSIRQVGKFDPREHSRACAVSCAGPSVTQQQFRDECDINVIIGRYGMHLPVGPFAGVYGDFTGIHDFESAVERVEAAKRSFMGLDAALRDRFGNDPGRFLREAGHMSAEELTALGRSDDSGRVPSGSDTASGGEPQVESAGRSDSGGDSP